MRFAEKSKDWNIKLKFAIIVVPSNFKKLIMSHLSFLKKGVVVEFFFSNSRYYIRP